MAGLIARAEWLTFMLPLSLAPGAPPLPSLWLSAGLPPVMPFPLS